MDKLIEAVKNAKCVAALTGAGVSTLCGIPDFRGPQGLYKNPDAERIFDIDWFDRDPSVYYRGCRELVYGLGQFMPGPVHTALKHLEDAGHLDGNVYEVHGSPRMHHCRNCGAGATFDEVMAMIDANGGVEKLGEPYVPRCSCGGVYKPDITFFGEALPEEAFTRSQELAIKADVMLVLGTSLTVYPAAGLPRLTLQRGGKVFIVNAQATSLDDYAEARYPDLLKFAEHIGEL